MGRGRPAKAVPEVSEATIGFVKEIGRGYEKMKSICDFIPKKRVSLFTRMKVSTERYRETGCVDYDRIALERIHPEDQKVVKGYEEKMRNIWLLEHGIAAIPDDRTRAIAKETLLGGEKVRELTEKYSISEQAIRARKREGIRYIAAFIEQRI